MLRRIAGLFRKKPKGEMTLSAVITRADGTVEDLGVISRTKTRGWRTGGQ